VTESPTVRLLEVQTCPVCAGVGHASAPKCLNCAGTGIRNLTRSLRVRVPAGVRDGDLIQVDGVARRFRLTVAPRPRDSSVILLVAGVALACALGLLFFLLFR
jgi:DnaJ-class molecular chaperone